jgi:hypothetical protein
MHNGGALFLQRGERRPRRAQLRRELHRRRERRRVPTACAAPYPPHGQLTRSQRRPVAVPRARDPLALPPAPSDSGDRRAALL